MVIIFITHFFQTMESIYLDLVVIYQIIKLPSNICIRIPGISFCHNRLTVCAPAYSYFSINVVDSIPSSLPEDISAAILSHHHFFSTKSFQLDYKHAAVSHISHIHYTHIHLYHDHIST